MNASSPRRSPARYCRQRVVVGVTGRLHEQNTARGGLCVRPSTFSSNDRALPPVGAVPLAQRVAVVRAVLLIALLRPGGSALRQRGRGDGHREDDCSKQRLHVFLLNYGIRLIPLTRDMCETRVTRATHNILKRT